MSDLQWAVVLVFFAGVFLMMGGQRFIWGMLTVGCVIAGFFWLMRWM